MYVHMRTVEEKKTHSTRGKKENRCRTGSALQDDGNKSAIEQPISLKEFMLIFKVKNIT